MLVPQKKNYGFTLLEILVALAILSIVAVTSLRNNTTMITNTSYLRDKTLAHWVAMNKAAELRLARQWVGKGGEKGVAVMGGRRWNWQVRGQDTPDPDIQLIDIKVGDAADKKENPLVSVALYLGRPAS